MPNLWVLCSGNVLAVLVRVRQTKGFDSAPRSSFLVFFHKMFTRTREREREAGRRGGEFHYVVLVQLSFFLFLVFLFLLNTLEGFWLGSSNLFLIKTSTQIFLEGNLCLNKYLFTKFILTMVLILRSTKTFSRLLVGELFLCCHVLWANSARE